MVDSPPVTVDSAPKLLHTLGLITAEAVLEGQLDVVSVTRRNRNLKVTSTTSGSYLIKQPSEPGTDAVRTLRQEARFLSYCWQTPRAEPVRSLLAKPVHVDVDRALLILEFLPEAIPLWQRYEQSKPDAFPKETAALVGTALGCVHETFWGLHRLAGRDLSWIGRDLPWAFSLHRPRLEALTSMSAANRDMVRTMQRNPSVFRRLDEMGSLWRCQTLIHGDVKMDNCLTLADGAGGERLVLVDWELVQWGDPAWDLAGALNDFLFFWVLSMPHDLPIDEMVTAARYPLPVLQPAVQALWQAYRSTRALPQEEAEELLGRAVRFASVRVLQTAYEIAGHFPVMPVPSVLLMQAAVNLLSDPDRGRAELFGLGDGV